MAKKAVKPLAAKPKQIKKPTTLACIKLAGAMQQLTHAADNLYGARSRLWHSHREMGEEVVALRDAVEDLADRVAEEYGQAIMVELSNEAQFRKAGR